MMPHRNAHALETEPVSKLLIQYSLPAIIGMVVYALYNIIDSIFIGHGLGSMAISGLAITFPVMNLVFAVGLLVGIGGAAVSSIRMGQQDMHGATRVLGNVLVLSILNGVLFAAVVLAFLDPILVLFGASVETLPHARNFTQVMLLGLPVTYVMSNLNQMMRANGYPRKAMYSTLLTVGVNCILAPLFLFGFGWGMRGAAFATVCAQISGMLWVLLHFMQPDSLLHFQRGIYRLSLPVVKSIFSIGLSPFMLNAAACIVVVLINVGASEQGGDMAVGAYGIINRVILFLVMAIVGLSQGMQPILGFNYGAKRHDRVRQTLRYGLFAAVGVTAFGSLLSQVAPALIVMMFTTDAVLLPLAEKGLRICTFAFALVGPQIIISNFFQSIGKAKISIFLVLTRQLLYLVPCLLVLPRFFGLNGIWFSLPLADTLAFVTSFLVLRYYQKKLEQV